MVETCTLSATPGASTGSLLTRREQKTYLAHLPHWSWHFAGILWRLRMWERGRRKSTGGGRNIDSRSAKHRGEWGWRTTPPSELARENKSTAASSPPNAKILIYFFFYLQLPSKWWIKQTETAACAQPNYAALRGGASPARPAPQWTMRGAARCSAAAIGWFKRRLFFFLDILAAHQSIFSI